MEFIDFQAEVEDDDNDTANNNLELGFAKNEEDKNFVNDSRQKPDTSLSFDRFLNQSPEIHNALNDRSNDNCKLDTHNLQPEMYWEIDRSFVEFDKFDS